MKINGGYTYIDCESLGNLPLSTGENTPLNDEQVRKFRNAVNGKKTIILTNITIDGAKNETIILYANKKFSGNYTDFAFSFLDDDGVIVTGYTLIVSLDDKIIRITEI